MVLGLFIVSWLIRRPAPGAPSMRAIAAGLIGIVIVMGTAWLGGELVDRLGVGVDDGANLDAPNSLVTRQARERRAREQAKYPGMDRRAPGSAP